MLVFRGGINYQRASFIRGIIITDYPVPREFRDQTCNYVVAELIYVRGNPLLRLKLSPVCEIPI